MASDENKFLTIFQNLDIKNVSFMLKLEMALATTIRMKFEPVCVGFGPKIRPGRMCYTALWR